MGKTAEVILETFNLFGSLKLDGSRLLYEGKHVGTARLYYGEKTNLKYIFLSQISIFHPFRNKKFASRFMMQLITYAKENSYYIILSPSDAYGTDINILASWYSSLGFIWNSGEDSLPGIYETMYYKS